MSRRLVLLFCSLPLASCVIGPTQAEAQAVAPPIEVMLARIDLGTGAAAPATIAPYIRVLDRLEAHCTEPRLRIATMSVAAAAELKRRYGQEASTLLVLQKTADGLEGAGLMEVRCQDALAAVVVQIGEDSSMPTRKDP